VQSIAHEPDNRIAADDNEFVVCFSDNGPHSWRWSGGMKGRKGSTDEGKVRSVCYIGRPPKISGGRTTQMNQFL
jgi:arylsulfatase A-like enzyme